MGIKAKEVRKLEMDSFGKYLYSKLQAVCLVTWATFSFPYRNTSDTPRHVLNHEHLNSQPNSKDHSVRTLIYFSHVHCKRHNSFNWYSDTLIEGKTGPHYLRVSDPEFISIYRLSLVLFSNLPSRVVSQTVSHFDEGPRATQTGPI
jgi:hypothetical protein